MNGLYSLVRFSKAIVCLAMFTIIGLSAINAQLNLELDVFSGISNLSPKTQKAIFELPLQGDVTISRGSSAGFQLGLSENIHDLGKISISGGYHHLSSNYYQTFQYEGMGLIKNVYHTHQKYHFLDVAVGFRYFLLRRGKSEFTLKGTIGGAMLIDIEWKRTSTKTYALIYESPVVDTEYRKYDGYFLPEFYLITTSIGLHYSYTISDLFKLNTGLGYYFYPRLENRLSGSLNRDWHSLYAFHLSMGVAFRISSPDGMFKQIEQ
jgi:hypothetical protein